MGNRLRAVLLLAVVLLLAAVNTSSGETLQDIEHALVISFHDAYLSEPPMVENGVLQLTLDEVKSALPPISYVSALVPYFARESILQRNSGPWIVQVISAKSDAQLIADIATRPEVRTCIAFTTIGQISGNLLGEATRAWFPPEASQQTGGFCRAQAYLHFPRPSELPAPTLDSLGVDACHWRRAEWEQQVPPPMGYPRDIDLPQAWGITRGAEEVVVAIIDTGVDWLHPDLGGPGIPEQGATLEQLLQSYTGGSIFQNTRDPIGTGDPDTCSGICGVDEDGDGTADEDPYGFLPGESPELDVVLGTVAEVIDATTIRTTAPVSPGALEGLWLRANIDGFYPLDGHVVTNTADTIVCSANEGGLGAVIAAGQAGWQVVTSAGATFLIGDEVDNDGDGFKDDFWGYDPSDDDENGVFDDLKGCDVTPTINPNLPPQQLSVDNDARPEILAVGPHPESIHGTWVAGVLGAIADAGGNGIVGVAPSVKILPIRAGDRGIFRDDLAEGIDYARRLRYPDGSRVVDVIVLATGIAQCDSVPGSMRCETFRTRSPATGEYIEPLAVALEAALADSIVIVDGAGNSNCEIPEPYYIACFPEVITVAGLWGADHPWINDDTNLGTTWGSWVDISADAYGLTVPSRCRDDPGYNCDCEYYGIADQPRGWACFKRGTSLASPLVGGVAALMLSANPDLSPSELRRKLSVSVDPIEFWPSEEPMRGKMGAGKVNAYKALTLWGRVPADPAHSDTTWAGDVYVSGDILVPPGRTLHLAAGTEIHFAQDDILAAGYDATQIEWRIEGSVVSLGTQGNPVVCRIFADQPGRTWGPITIAESAGTVSFLHMEFADLETVDETVTAPPTGDGYVQGVPISIEWTTAYESGHGYPAGSVVDHVALFVSTDGGQNFRGITLNAPNTGHYDWTPVFADVSGNVIVRVQFYNAAGLWLGSDDSDGAFAVYAAGGIFANLTADTELDYQGTPYSSVAFDYDGDQDVDLVISITDAPSQLYRQQRVLPSGAPQFVRVTNEAFPDPAERPQAVLRGLAVGSYDGDGRPDVVATSPLVTGTRLYKNLGPTPAPNGPVTFDDVATTVQVAAPASFCSSAAWGDYDGDRDLDLFLGRAFQSGGVDPDPGNVIPAPPVLLENDVDSTGVFIVVTDESQLAVGSASWMATLSAAWADIDHDGDQDLFAGHLGPPGERSAQLFLSQLTETGSPTFVEGSAARGIGGLGFVSGGVWSDITGDGWLDLVVSEQDAGEPMVKVYVNDQTGHFPNVVAANAGLAAVDVRAFDENLDGRVDLVVMPASDGAYPRLLTNIAIAQPPFIKLVDRSVAAELDEAGGAVRGAVAADFDDDGRVDLYLGRPLDVPVPKAYFRSKLPDQPPQGYGERRHIHLAFEGAGGGNEPGATGTWAVVKRDGVPFLGSVIDGGSGRGGQGSGAVHTGVGEGTGLFEVETHWAEGFVQTDTLALDQLNTIVDRTDPTIFPAAMSASYTVGPDGTAIVTLKWESQYKSVASLDQAHMSSTYGCMSEPQVFMAEMPNVDVTLSQKPTGRWLHTMVITDLPCIPNCTYTWYCESGTSVVTATTAGTPQTFKTKICAQ